MPREYFLVPGVQLSAERGRHRRDLHHQHHRHHLDRRRPRPRQRQQEVRLPEEDPVRWDRAPELILVLRPPRPPRHRVRRHHHHRHAVRLPFACDLFRLREFLK